MNIKQTLAILTLRICSKQNVNIISQVAIYEIHRKKIVAFS